MVGGSQQWEEPSHPGIIATVCVGGILTLHPINVCNRRVSVRINKGFRMDVAHGVLAPKPASFPPAHDLITGCWCHLSDLLGKRAVFWWPGDQQCKRFCPQYLESLKGGSGEPRLAFRQEVLRLSQARGWFSRAAGRCSSFTQELGGGCDAPGRRQANWPCTGHSSVTQEAAPTRPEADSPSVSGATQPEPQEALL